MSAIRPVALESADGAKRACAEAIARHLAQSTAPSLVLAGGSTPEATYALLAQEYRTALDWGRVHFFFGDERCVGPDHPKSNYGMARRSLLEPLAVPAQHVHRMLGELGGDAAAERYERLLEAAAEFSVVLLGMGPEGHTASLFPNSPALRSDRLAVGTIVPTPPPKRITLTPRALGRAERVFFLVTGAEKAAALEAALAAAGADAAVPTSFVRGRLETLAFCDLAACAGGQPPS